MPVDSLFADDVSDFDVSADDVADFDVSADDVSDFDVSAVEELVLDFAFFVSDFFAIFACAPLNYRLESKYSAPFIDF